MGDAAVLVHGKRYVLPCAPEGGVRLQDRAGALDGRIAELEAMTKQAGRGKPQETHLILMAALALMDELAEARAALGHARQDAAFAKAALAQESAEKAHMAKAAAEALARAARRVETLASELDRD